MPSAPLAAPWSASMSIASRHFYASYILLLHSPLLPSFLPWLDVLPFRSGWRKEKYLRQHRSWFARYVLLPRSATLSHEESACLGPGAGLLLALALLTTHALQATAH